MTDTGNATEAALAEARATADAERARADAAKTTADAERTRAAKLEGDLRKARDAVDLNARAAAQLDAQIATLQSDNKQLRAQLEAQAAEHANALDVAKQRAPVAVRIPGLDKLKLKAGAGRVLNLADAKLGKPVRVIYGGTAFDITPGKSIAGDVVRLVHSARTYVAPLSVHGAMARWWATVRAAVVP